MFSSVKCFTDTLKKDILKVLAKMSVLCDRQSHPLIELLSAVLSMLKASNFGSFHCFAICEIFANCIVYISKCWCLLKFEFCIKKTLLCDLHGSTF